MTYSYPVRGGVRYAENGWARVTVTMSNTKISPLVTSLPHEGHYTATYNTIGGFCSAYGDNCSEYGV